VKEKKEDNSISYKLLITIMISFIIGMISILIIENYVSSEKIEFSTLGLIGFIFSIIFAGSSIVLAITAINLGRSSEQAMIDRSERSIEIQNEVYIRTTEALKKIEASTGVTEKRIEDIIAGRVGDIATRLVDSNIVTEKDKDRLETELKKSISKEVTQEEIQERNDKAMYRLELDKKYDTYKTEVLLNLTNLEKIKCLRMSEGSYIQTGEKLLDGLFDVKGHKFGICCFIDDPTYEKSWGKGIDRFLNNLAEEISINTFEKTFLAFNELLSIGDMFNKEINKIKKLYQSGIANNIILISGNPEEIVQLIDKSVIK